MAHIIAMGGGGFSMEPENLALDRYVIAQTGKPQPKVCFLAQASGESLDYTVNFYNAFNQLGCHASHLSLFKPHTADLNSFLLGQDIIYVGGGNTKSMLALWREWELPDILKRANEQGTVLAGISAGSICWFERGLTDSIPGDLTALPCLGFLKGSCTPHYDGEAQRRPSYQGLVGSGALIAGYAFDDGAAGHFVDGELKEVVSSRPHAKGYHVSLNEGKVLEKVLETRYLNK
ncbi:MAG: peptidase E [Chloroflexi bacterium]|nr:peptidase E [Chloroflexota bacterium]MCC6894776.1 peptidase E [Anaerolineae bacterium]